MRKVRSYLGRRLVRDAHRRRERDAPGAGLLFRAARAIDPGNAVAAREAGKLGGAGRRGPRRLRFLIVGTTGLCNASCIHCPTGKLETAHVPRTPMPMPLFTRLLDGLVAEGVEFEHRATFGLFGDAFVDPFVEARTREFKRRLPDVGLSLNTNGAAYAPKHRALAQVADLISLHCESLRDEVYDDLMRPLRLARVRPKLEAILRDFPRKVHVSVPVSRRNRDELPAMRDWFYERGAINVVFDPLGARCAQDQRLFDTLALAPQQIRCGPEVGEDLIVDSDGMVMACCQDFERIEPIGDLKRQTVGEVLAASERRRFAEQMAQGRHGEWATCSRCRSDLRTPDFPFDCVSAPAPAAGAPVAA